MKKKILSVLITILAVCTLMFTMTACAKDVKLKLKFVVDNEIYATIDTSGVEIIQMPENPTKEDYIFDGWFWDKDVWEKPFTANSLLDAPLSSDMSVYAKFSKNHTHEYNSVVTEPTCTEKGYTTHTCSCGDSYVDAYVDELGHEYGVWVSNSDGTHTKTCANDNSHKLTEDCVYNYVSNNNGTKTGTCECDYSIIAVDEKVLVVENNVVKRMTEYGKTLSKIVISNSVTSIGDDAFFGCSSLTSVVIGDSVTDIGDYAFLGCSSLTSIEIPDSVESIGELVFSGCRSLTSVEIPDSVTSIGYNAFYNCSKLTSVIIGDSVTSIGDDAFFGCSSLTSVVIPDSVTSIGEFAFYDCSSLESVIIGDSVTSIGEFAFYFCSSLESIKYRGTESQWQAITKGSAWNSYTGKYTITYNYTGE